jgi:acyl-coenzyme A synthetase/AMP-(fatty) acid ligase
MTYLSERVARCRKVRLIEFVDAIPMPPTGKILRRFQVE